jgi:carbon monoxide dehydrogenase subunit G
MELEHSFTVPVPEDRAWDVLLDVERVAPCMPGATLQSIDGDEIHGTIKVKVGPISMTYQGTAHFTERDPAEHVITLEATGKETRGAGTASAKVRSMLEAAGDQTHVVVHTSLNVTGKPAQFGRGVMAEVGGKLVGIFADNLAAMLAAEPAAASDEADEADEEEAQELAGTGVEPAAASTDEALPIDVLNLPIRAWNGLRRDSIQTLGDLIRRTPEQLLAIDNIGPASLAEISRRLADRGLALASSDASATGTGAAGPADSDGGQAAGAAGVAADKAAANGGGPAAAASAPPAPREPVGWQPQDDAIDLLGVAGLPVLKRALPAAAGLIALLLVFLGLRRRRARRG